jgi:flavin-dependent dehydrogenase
VTKGASETIEHDLLIVGAGPAGCAAALRARTLGLSVLLLEKRPAPAARVCNGWISPAGVALCETLNLNAKQVGAVKFESLGLHTWDLRKHTEVKEKDIWGWLIDRSVFDDALLNACRAAEAAVHTGVAAVHVSLGEKLVRVRRSDGAESVARMLIVADGLQSQAAAAVNLATAATIPKLPQCIFVEYETPKVKPGLDVVVGTSRAGLIATITRLGDHTRLALMTRGSAADMRAALEPLIEGGRSAGLLPRATSPAPQSFTSPAGAALDLDTHVGKRCLLIGDAGGFVAAFSNEGIYPAMKSGVVAVDVAARALKSPVVQDELASFGSEWRTQLADYLRMPNADLSLLVPLVFSNPQMCLRVARAFLHGQAF